MTPTIGIDPGEKGAMCVLYPDNSMIFYTGLEEYRQNIYKYPGCSCAIERQNCNAMQKGAGTTMLNYGRLLEIVESSWCHMTIVTPQQWYRFFSIKGGLKYSERKQFTAKLLEKYLPQSEISKLYGPRGGLLDGRSDAAAIALYHRGG